MNYHQHRTNVSSAIIVAVLLLLLPFSSLFRIRQMCWFVSLIVSSQKFIHGREWLAQCSANICCVFSIWQHQEASINQPSQKHVQPKESLFFGYFYCHSGLVWMKYLTTVAGRHYFVVSKYKARIHPTKKIVGQWKSS